MYRQLIPFVLLLFVATACESLQDSFSRNDCHVVFPDGTIQAFSTANVDVASDTKTTDITAYSGLRDRNQVFMALRLKINWENRSVEQMELSKPFSSKSQDHSKTFQGTVGIVKDNAKQLTLRFKNVSFMLSQGAYLVDGDLTLVKSAGYYDF